MSESYLWCFGCLCAVRANADGRGWEWECSRNDIIYFMDLQFTLKFTDRIVIFRSWKQREKKTWNDILKMHINFGGLQRHLFRVVVEIMQSTLYGEKTRNGSVECTGTSCTAKRCERNARTYIVQFVFCGSFIFGSSYGRCKCHRKCQ